MRKMKTLNAALAGLLLSATGAAAAATFSSTKAELLYGFDYERQNEEQALLTLANTTGFSKGDSYFFLDVGISMIPTTPTASIWNGDRV